MAAEILVGTEVDFEGDTRLFVEFDGTEVGILRHDGEYHAFQNRCAHQGGPVCDGTVIGKVETVLSLGQEQTGQRFSETDLHLVCPWHGWEYDLRTGVCAADSRFRLRRYQAVCRDGKVYVKVEEQSDRQLEKASSE